MIRPFSYQKSCLKQLVKARKQRKKQALVVMATGLGKTITVALDVKKWLKLNPNSRILYLCHQNNILKKSRLQFQEIVDGDINKYGYYFGTDKKFHAQILFASFQTMRTNLHRFGRKDFGYIIVDESHHSQAETYRPIVDYFRPKFLLGLTATPDRNDLKDIRDIFGKEVFSLELPEALARNYLAQVEYKLITDELIDVGKIENPYRLTVKELNKRIFVPKRDKEIARIIREKTSHLKNPRMMVFCSSISHADKFQAHMPGSITIHSGLPQSEQNVRLEAFEKGVIGTALTIDKFNEGIDVPEIQVVVFLRSTQSDTIFYQQLGRGLRKLLGKKVLVLDFVANAERIQMIHKLKEKVLKARKQNKTKKSRSMERDAHFNGFDFVFTEKAKDILKTLNKIKDSFYPTWQESSDATRNLGIKSRKDYPKRYRENHRLPSAPHHMYSNYPGDSMFFRGKTRTYTREGLISHLQKLAKKIGHTPTIKDVSRVSKEGEGWSPKTFDKVFGSFSNAQRAAGLSTYRRFNYNETEMILKLKDLAKNLGKSPSLRDIKKASKAGMCPTSNTYRKIFGSINKSLEVAGLSLNRKVGHSRESVIKDIQRLAKKLGRTPRIKDIDEASKHGQVSCAATIFRILGSFNSAVKAAGFQANKPGIAPENITKESRIHAQS